MGLKDYLFYCESGIDSPKINTFINNQPDSIGKSIGNYITSHPKDFDAIKFLCGRFSTMEDLKNSWSRLYNHKDYSDAFKRLIQFKGDGGLGPAEVFIAMAIKGSKLQGAVKVAGEDEKSVKQGMYDIATDNKMYEIKWGSSDKQKEIRTGTAMIPTVNKLQEEFNKTIGVLQKILPLVENSTKYSSLLEDIKAIIKLKENVDYSRLNKTVIQQFDNFYKAASSAIGVKTSNADFDIITFKGSHKPETIAIEPIKKSALLKKKITITKSDASSYREGIIEHELSRLKYIKDQRPIAEVIKSVLQEHHKDIIIVFVKPSGMTISPEFGDIRIGAGRVLASVKQNQGKENE